MSYNEYDSLIHFGIPGQKWGVRRYQNEDGTLTEEGKARYYDTLTDRQKKLYDKFSPKNQERIEKKMAEGKSFTRAAKETADRNRAVGNLTASAAFLAAYGAVYGSYLLAAFPQIRHSLKRSMLTKVSKIVNTKAVGGTLLKAKKFIDHLKMRKAGSVFVKAKDIWISGDKLGA